MIRNTTIAEKTGLLCVSAIIDTRRAVSTRCTLRLAMDVRSGTPPVSVLEATSRPTS